MKNILIALFFFSCSPSRLQVGSKLSSSTTEGGGILSVPLVEISDEFNIYLIPSSITFGPNLVPGKDYYLGTGQLSTVNGTLSESTVRSLLTTGCGSRCTVLLVEGISGNPNLWSYQVGVLGVEEFTLKIAAGIPCEMSVGSVKDLSLEKPDLKTKHETDSKFVYSGINITQLGLYYNLIPGKGEFSTTTSTLTVPIGTNPANITVNLLDLKNLTLPDTLPVGCEGLEFSETIVENQQIILASLKFTSQSQVCYLSIPEGEILGSISDQVLVNHNTQIVLSYNGVSIIETSPVVAPSSFTISMIPSTITSNISLVQVLSPYSISANDFVSGLTFTGCTGGLTSSGSNQTQFTLSVQFSGNNLCLITMPAALVSFQGMTNNAGSLALMPLSQAQIVSTTNITNIVNNYIINNNNIYSPQFTSILNGSSVGYEITLPGEMSVGSVKDLLTISSGCKDVLVEFISTKSMKYAQGSTGPTILSTYQITATEKPGETCIVTLPPMYINDILVSPPPPIVCPPGPPVGSVSTSLVINGVQLEIYDTKAPQCDKFLEPSNLVVKVNGKLLKTINFLTSPKAKGKNTFNLCRIKHKKSLKNGVYRLDLTRSLTDCSGTATDNTSTEVTVAGNKIVKIGNTSCPTTSNDTEDVPTPTPEITTGPTTNISIQGSIISINDSSNGATCPWSVDETGIRAILKPSNKILFTKKLLERSFDLCGYDAGSKVESGKVYAVQLIRKVTNCNGSDQSTVNVNLTVDESGSINTVNGISCGDMNPTSGPTPGPEVKGPTTDISAQGTVISIKDNSNGGTCSWIPAATVVRATLQPQGTILFTREFPGTPQGVFTLCGKTVNNQGEPGKVYPVSLTRQVKNCEGTAQDSVNISISVNNSGYINTVNGVSCGNITPDNQTDSNATIEPDSSTITDPIRDNSTITDPIKTNPDQIQAVGVTPPSFGQTKEGHSRGLLAFYVLHGMKNGVKITEFSEPPYLKITAENENAAVISYNTFLENNLSEVIPKNSEFKTPPGYQRDYLINLCRIFNNNFTTDVLYKNVIIEVMAKDIAGEALSGRDEWHLNGKKLMLSGALTLIEGVKVTENNAGEKSFSLHNASGTKIAEYTCAMTDSKFNWNSGIY